MKSFDSIATHVLLPALGMALLVAAYLTFVEGSSVDVDLKGSSTENRVLSSADAPQLEPQLTGEGQSEVNVGTQYHSLAELDAVQHSSSYVRVGLFGNYWPARVVEIQVEDDGIRFIRGSGTPHTYSKFEGYRMQMVRLHQGSNETVVVYRSMEKRR